MQSNLSRCNTERTTILVVDDDEQIRRVVSRCLESLGGNLLEADSGRQAEQCLRSTVPDLILLDVNLLDTDGYELCRRLRARPNTRDVPVLMITGDQASEALQRAYDAGATDFVAKPFDLTVLEYRVRYLLRSCQASRALRRSERRLATAQRIAHVGHWELDVASGEMIWSAEVYRIFGLAEDACVDWDVQLQHVFPDDRTAFREFCGDVGAGRTPAALHYRIRRPDGTVRFLFQQAARLDEECPSCRVVGTIQDITERKEAEATIRFLAQRDPLTGLPNRRLFQERLQRALHRAGRGQRRVAVMHLDIDRFKIINEGYGHEAGDRLLRAVAERLTGCLRLTDTVARDQAPARPTLSRLGGDEFMIVLQDLEQHMQPAAVAGRILRELGRPFSVDGTEILVTVSVGIAMAPDDGTDADKLTRRAETALAHAKGHGGNRVVFYNGRMNSDAAARLALASRLHRAVTERQFTLAYQPIFATATRRAIGVEALIRWDDPIHGAVAPGDFIAVAEETGLILPIGDWVLEQACVQWRDWYEQGLGAVEIAINVSTRQFQDGGFVGRVRKLLERHHVNPASLRFEITERVLMESNDTILDSVQGLRELGIPLSVDDFGTGYSSLGYLHRFPADVLKIDRTFVAGVPEDRESCSLVSAMVAMAHKLRLQVVAEGVENEAQLRFLDALDCEQIQGFLLARPAPASEVTAVLRAGMDPGSRSAVLPFRVPANG